MSDPAPTVDPAAESEKPTTGKLGCFSSWVKVFGVLGMLFLTLSMSLGPMGHSPGSLYENTLVKNTRQIGLMMFAYSNDHDQNYPDGKSSTEVFQKLIDGQYCEDPSIFFIPIPGKTKALPDEKLKPENVCFDVTGGVDSSSPDELPLVFITGYQVIYAPGASAVPLSKPYPRYGNPSWLERWQWGGRSWPDPGIAVAWKSCSTKFLKLPPIVNPDGSISYPPRYKSDALIPNFIPQDFNARGKTYHQLTPDGELPQKPAQNKISRAKGDVPK